MKVGIEASRSSKRVSQWTSQKAGGSLVAEIRLDADDLAAGRGAVLFDIEQSLHGSSGLSVWFEPVQRDEYVAAFADAGFTNGPADGYAETYIVDDWSLAWDAVTVAVDDADLYRLGSP